MGWGLLLLAFCVIAALFNRRTGIVFAASLIAAMAITIANPPFVQVWFFASYACIGILLFLFFDWKLGALIGIVSLASFAHVAGYINALHRDIAGEILFALCLLAGTFSKPSGGISGFDAGSVLRGGNNPRNRLSKGA